MVDFQSINTADPMKPSEALILHRTALRQLLNRDYLKHIADAIERAIRYASSLQSLQALEQDELSQDAIVRTLGARCAASATKSCMTTSMWPGMSFGRASSRTFRHYSSRSNHC
jgi:hypothetical protein